MTTPRSRLGALGETVAAAHLEAQGLNVVDRNFRTRYGEVDLIAEDSGTLVFVEVKTRRSLAFGAPEESVTPRKRARLAKVAAAYLQLHGLEQRNWRIDVVGVALQRTGPATINHVRAVEVAEPG